MHLPNVNSVACSPNGKTIIIGNEDKTARLWDITTGRTVGEPYEHRDPVVSVAFSPDGKTILTGSADRTARLWEAATARSIGQPMVHGSGLHYVLFSRDGKLVLTHTLGGVTRLWDAATSQPVSPPVALPPEESSLAISPDLRTVVSRNGGRSFIRLGWESRSDFGKARLWDVITGQFIGPRLEGKDSVDQVSYSPDSKSIVTRYSPNPSGHTDIPARLWHLPAVVDEDLPTIEAWAATMTGLGVDDQGNIRSLDSEAWQEQRERLRQLGGPPKTDSRWLLDPILYGPDPTGRARAWVERKRWAEAEAAFAEAVCARPLDALAERGRYYVMRSEPEKAAADFLRALVLGKRDSRLFADIVVSDRTFDRALALLPAEETPTLITLLFQRVVHLAKEGRLDEARAVFARSRNLPWEEAELSTPVLEPGRVFALLGFSDKVTALFNKYRHTINPNMANEVAWYCVLAPAAVPDHDAPVQLAEIAVKGFPPEQTYLALNTLGAALYRARRVEHAIRRLEEGIERRKGESLPQDWAFLAMAHHRLGHRDEALRRLDRQPNTDRNQFWDELEIRLLRSEAEAVVLYDPIFPADPFAR